MHNSSSPSTLNPSTSLVASIPICPHPHLLRAIIILLSPPSLVFKRIVENSVDHPGKPPRPQYFLITPKLLQGLTAMENEQVTVLFVFNGPHNLNKPNGDRWDLMEIIKKRKALGDVDTNRYGGSRHINSGSAVKGGKKTKSSDKRRRTGPAASAENEGLAAEAVEMVED